MAESPKGESSLNSLRHQIDEIDDTIHDLLMRRIELARSIGQEKSQALGTAFRPAREAQIMRRLAARHEGPFPFAVAIRIWREIIAASLSVEGKFVVSVYVPEPLEAGLAYLALASAYFGSQTPLLQAQTEAGVLRAVRDGKAAVGVLPIASDTHTTRASAEPWWYTLTAGGSERPRVVANLPWLINSDTGSDAARAMAVARINPEASGDDISLIAFESTENISRGRIRKEAEGAGLMLDWAATWSHDEQPARWQLAHVEGFVPEYDPRLAGLVNTLEGELTRFVNLGCYARPGNGTTS
ncbi:MAG: chorismate mutase [Rhodospirillaceae bacterium]|jgi:chorismate mutase-like protein|nr:chorismate mutase [Rhodospirillaceae bacterium]MBT3926106.1 chorismate mutase [Rhodospirillaceae bacterium]MBT4426015.1 chorismate mutase [Rhodospirillaceae bacterium]MBT5037077.1 chorismate mutase [Rhodospirillaceae bacterium]MBT5676772.1 chorismate mutase [Rhodospirillaceae bacterium]